MKTLMTVDEVVNALGGNRPVAELLGRGSSAVSNWRKAGRFADRASDRAKIQAALAEKGMEANESLFDSAAA